VVHYSLQLSLTCLVSILVSADFKPPRGMRNGFDASGACVSRLVHFMFWGRVGVQIESVPAMNKTTRILVVDDNLEVLRLFSEMLRAHGYEVCEASTGRRALQMTRQTRPDLLLLDVVMADLSGIEVCRQVKADPLLADVFVVLVSGQATSSAEMVHGLEAGADDYIPKPVDPAEFLARIRTIVRLRDTAAELRASERHYRSLVDILPEGVGMIDLEGRFAAVNPQAVAMLGFADGEELLKKSVVDLIQPEDRERLRVNMARALKTGVLRNAPYTMIRKQGQPLAVELSAAVSTDAKGQPLGLVMVARDITEHKRAEEDLRSVSRRIIEAQEAERLRVARELHDGVNQVLASVKMRLRKVEDMASELKPAAREILSRSHRLIIQALEENRRIAHNLRPSDLDDLGLAAACQNFCKEARSRTNLTITCSVPRLRQRVAAMIELNLFRIVQEAVNNVEKHAHAKTVQVRILHKVDSMMLQVRDDGRGFESREPKAGKGIWRGNGLSNMQQRAMAVGGTCKVESVPKKGTIITVRVPIEKVR
jgi:PAS domain S-box-containing protein